MPNHIGHFSLLRKLNIEACSRHMQKQLHILLTTGGVMGVKSANKNIISICSNGLSNRIISLINTKYWANHLALPYTFYWGQDTNCFCNVSDIFNIDSQNNNLVATIQKTIDEKQIPSDIYDIDSSSFNIKAFDTIFLNTWSIPKYIEEQQRLILLSSFSIREDILKCAKEFISNNIKNKSVKGILLRGTDGHKWGIETNNDFYFKMIEKSKDSFFITSDDEEQYKRFKALQNVTVYPTTAFPIYNTNTDVVYRSKQSVIEGFINMLILSRTDIINATGSSFQKLAQLYSKIDI
jgi:hypothetical protein